MNQLKTKFLIIGAGPTGLGAAYRLKELGETDFTVIEKNNWVGGLATSFLDDHGFTWDIGGHVQFSHYEYFDRVMDLALSKDNWLNHNRESWVWMKDRFIPYPFQYNIRHLPKNSLWACLKGVIAQSMVKKHKRPKNFEDWILNSFGLGIANEFMLPYNKKVWAISPKEMQFNWIGERVAVIDLERLIENIVLEKDDISWGPNNTFRFPKSGGTGAIWNSVADMIGREKVGLNSELLSIDTDTKTANLVDGSSIHYEFILSTIPLDILTTKIASLPTNINTSSGKLFHSTSHIVGIGVKGKAKEELATKCWMYFPEDNCPFYRVTLFSNYSPNNVPDSKEYFSLMAETSASSHKQVNQEKIIEDTVQGLINTKLLQPEDRIESYWHYRASYGYPVPVLGRDLILRNVISQLDSKQVYSRGRFGGWKYEVSNQDHTFMQGVEWVNLILNGEPEETFTLLEKNE